MVIGGLVAGQFFFQLELGAGERLAAAGVSAQTDDQPYSAQEIQADGDLLDKADQTFH